MERPGKKTHRDEDLNEVTVSLKATVININWLKRQTYS